MLISKELENEIVESTIPSKTLKQWIKDNNHKFQCGELASLIYNSESLLMRNRVNLMNKMLFELNRLGSESCSDDVKVEIDTAVVNINSLLEDVYEAMSIRKGTNNRVIKFTRLTECTDTEERIIDSIETLEKLVEVRGYRLANNSVTIINTASSDEIMWVGLDDSFQIKSCMRIDTDGDEDSDNGGYRNLFIDIPMECNIGDVVTICGDEEHKRYVVCSSNIMPDNIKKDCDYYDCCVTVIPEDLLDSESNKSYREQINDILSKRIRNMDETDKTEGTYKGTSKTNGTDGTDRGSEDNKVLARDSVTELDLISVYHEHISTVLVEKA